MRARFGALGRHGSIALVERFHLTLKSEGLRRILVPYRIEQMVSEVQYFIGWYNGARPHMGLGGATPNEIYARLRPARDGPRFEMRMRYPVRGRRLRAAKGAALELRVRCHEGRAHLPIVELRTAA